MPRNGPNRKKLALALSAAFILMTLLMGALAFLGGDLIGGDGAESPDAAVMASADGEPESSDGEEPRDADSPEESSGSGEEPEEEPEPEPVYFNVPDELRAVMISAGTDYLTTDAPLSSAELGGQLDRALAAAQELTMNSIIIDTKYRDAVLFTSDTLEAAPLEIDVTSYLADKAREMGFYVYATYDVSDLAGDDGKYLRAANADGRTLDSVRENIGSFAETYKLDGILLDGYENPADGQSYAQYLENGGGVGYQNYLRQVPSALVSAAASAVRERAPGTQVGLLADAVWENAAENPGGTDTKAERTALGYGNADTKAMVESGLFDFVMVKNYGSTNEETARFGVVAEWWKQVARGADTTLYMMHAADRVGTQSIGWTVYEQLTKQVIDLQELGGVSGNAFNSLAALSANPGNSTTTLVQYLNNEINEQWVLTQLAITTPQQMTFTTKEQSVTFQGASDPQAEVTMNGETIPTNESGYFAIREDLTPGLNTFTFVHKGKTLTYSITRQVQVIKEVTPTGKLAVDGGMEVTVSVLAYEDAKVSASVGGQTITLSQTEDETDEADSLSGYKRFTGVFTAPSASASATTMGNITFTATAQGETQSVEGALVTVNKRAVMGEGSVVYVVADQAETFPINTLNDNSNSGYFPLPKGTVDKTYGDEIVYKNGSVTKTYWKLESGVRVYSDDIKASGGSMPDQNVISGMSVKSSGAYTSVSLEMDQKVPYKVAYDGSQIIFKFDYTARTPDSDSIKSNALFKSAKWEGSNLNLTLKKAGGFLGYKAYYEGNSLVLRFNNSPGSLSGARIVVDPGHGGNDPGNLGFYPGKDEADINLAVAKKLVSDLKSQGATVLMAEPGSTMATRMAAARAFNAQVLVSVHSNSAPNVKATGTEVYYFYPFSKQLAANISANVSKALGSDNRGAKAGLYYMTRESQFACVLAELGFMSNEGEYTKLINSKYQSRMAEAIANGISAYLGGASSGSYSSSGDDEDEDDDDDEDGGNLRLNETELDLEVGDTFPLKVSGAGGADVSWETDDKSVATVNSSGKVVAKGEGKTRITAYTDDDEARCTVYVGGGSGGDGGDVTKIVVEADEEEIEVGTRTTLSVRVSPSDADDDRVKWVTDDDDIVELSNLTSSSCKVEGLRDGTATITAIARDGSGVRGSIDIVVGTGKYKQTGKDTSSTAPKKGVKVEAISIDGPSTLYVGDGRSVYTGTVSPANAEDPGIKWSVTDRDILELYNTDDENVVKVEGLKAGTAYLVGEPYDKSKVVKKFKITVKK